VIDLRTAPLSALSSMVNDLDQGFLATRLKASQRKAWVRYRDNPVYPGVAFRFTFPAQPVMGFSYRLRSWGKGKRQTPPYVRNGAFRESLAKRKPRLKRDGTTDLATSFSIFGGAMNLLGQDNQRGLKLAPPERFSKGKVLRAAHRRRCPSGTVASVRAYSQVGYDFADRRKTAGISDKTYAQEWAFQPGEIAVVQEWADTFFLEDFRRLGVNSKTGQLKARATRDDIRTRRAA